MFQCPIDIFDGHANRLLVENDFISTLKDDVGIITTCVLSGWLSPELNGQGWVPQGAMTSSSNPARLCRG